MAKEIKIDKQTAKKIVVEKKLNESLKEHKHVQVINFKADSFAISHSRHLI